MPTLRTLKGAVGGGEGTSLSEILANPGGSREITSPDLEAEDP